MSYEAPLRELLQPLFAGGVFPDTLPDAHKIFPAAVYNQVGGEETWYVDNSIPDHLNARVQITIFAEDRVQANDLARNVGKRLADNNFIVRPIGAFTGGYDDANGIYMTHRDFSLWYSDNMPGPDPIADGYVDQNGDSYVDQNGDNYTWS